MFDLFVLQAGCSYMLSLQCTVHNAVTLAGVLRYFFLNAEKSNRIHCEGMCSCCTLRDNNTSETVIFRRARMSLKLASKRSHTISSYNCL